MTTTTAPNPPAVTDIDPGTLASWLERGEALLVDVREDFEYAEEHIRGSIHTPLSKLDPATLRARLGDARPVFQCRSGKRSAVAAHKYRSGDEPLFHLAGGIEAWKQAGKPVVKPASGPKIPVMRQVQITAGSLVTLGVALGAFVHPGFLALAAFIGVGLVFAGASGWCGMALLLAKMPWNRSPGGASC